MRLGFHVEWLVQAAVLFVAWQWTDGHPLWLVIVVSWVVLILPTGIRGGLGWLKQRRSTNWQAREFMGREFRR